MKFGQGWGRPFTATKCQCIVCQRVFEKRAVGPAPLYCSRTCRGWWQQFDRRAKTAIEYWNRRCESCEDPLFDRGVILSPGAAGGSAAKRFCSPQCLSYSLGETITIHNRSRVPWRKCQDCGVWLASSSRYRPLCQVCRKMAQADNDRRKNRKRRLTGRGGSYKLSDIAARDGYRCHLCNRKVDMGLSGDHKQGPTIDHLIPISQGGDDVESNVALAHRSCNCSRQDKGTVQLRLAS